MVLLRVHPRKFEVEDGAEESLEVFGPNDVSFCKGCPDLGHVCLLQRAFSEEAKMLKNVSKAFFRSNSICFQFFVHTDDILEIFIKPLVNQFVRLAMSVRLNHLRFCNLFPSLPLL